MYKKPAVEVVKFDFDVFMMSSGGFGPAGSALSGICQGFSWEGFSPNKFSCGVFGGISDPNSHSNATATDDHGNTYTFNYHGNHWACSIFN